MMRICGARFGLRCWRLCGIFLLLLGGTWLLLGSPCSLLSCPVTDNSQSSSSSQSSQVEIDCSSLNLVSSDKSQKLQGSPQLGVNGPYDVLYDYLTATNKYSGNDSVTYTTHSTPEFLENVGEIANRWDGPVSVAVYVPHTDFCLAVTRIIKLRVCGSTTFKEKVTWHLYWPRNLPPPLNWRRPPDETTVDCKIKEDYKITSWRASHNQPYPVNVARNIARSSAPTWFVLPSDVELYPSNNMATEFIQFISLSNKDPKLVGIWPRVFVVPVFEAATVVPNTKEELISQYTTGESVYFHRYICGHCQKFPGLYDWLHNSGTPGKLQVSLLINFKSFCIIIEIMIYKILMFLSNF